MNTEKEPTSKQVSLWFRFSPWTQLMVVVYFFSVAFAGAWYLWIENKQQKACERFLAYQTNYAQYLTDVDDFITSVAQGRYDNPPPPFSSSAALSIELSDPFGISPQATRLSEALRAVSRTGGFRITADRNAWIKDTVARRDQFVLSVQEANPCIQT